MFQDVDIPKVAKLVFDSCEFDAEFEEVFWLNIYHHSISSNRTFKQEFMIFRSYSWFVPRGAHMF